MSDDATYKIVAKDISSECHLTVEKGEDKPVIRIEKDPEGPGNKPFIFDVPYESKYLDKLSISSIGDFLS